MLKAVLMDFDGVIIDSESVWYDVYATWFDKNYQYPLSVKEFLLCVGANYEQLFKMLEEKNAMRIDRDQFFADTMDLFIEKSDTLPAIDGVFDFIKTVKQQGLSLALVTSATSAKPIKHLTRLGLIDYFDLLVTAECVNRIKPFPDLYLKSLEELNIASREAVVVEDSKNGLTAAERAEINTIVVPNRITKYSEFQGHHQKVDSLNKIDVSKLISDFINH